MSSAPPVALTLVAASYSTAAWVRLSFDRDINIAAIHVGAIIVSDANTGQTYVGSGVATRIATQTVQVPLAILTTSTGSGIKLTASGATGIVAVNDGGTWGGVSQLVLPFP